LLIYFDSVIAFAFLLFPIIWTTVGASVPSVVFIADMCPNLENYVQNRSISLKPWIEYYTSCQGINPLLDEVQKANSSLIEVENYLEYVKTHNVSNKEAIIEALEKVISDLDELNLLLHNLSDCNIVQYPYSQAKQKVCISILNLTASIFLVCGFSGLVLFISLWILTKLFARQTIIKNKQVLYSPINQSSNSLFPELELQKETE